jgi:molybdopterin-guanine dinucleotide biosynthesis protein A
MKCFILAGGRVEESDPLFQYSGGRPKALINLGGKSLLEWVIEAMIDASSVDQIAVVGVDESHVRRFNQPVDFFPDQGSIVSNAFLGIDWAREQDSDESEMLFCTADIPTITGTLVDEHIALCHPFDKSAYYAFVNRQTMESRFPGADRTYTRLDGLDVASCDMMVLRTELAEVDRNLFDSLANVRKHPWRVAKTVGIRTLVRLMLGQMTMDKVEQTAERILQQPVKVFLSERAELAMDIDKPSHLELIRSEFE